MVGLDYYLGMDAGGSKTLAVLVDGRGVELARAQSGPGNHQVDRDEARENIHQAALGAISGAGLRVDQVTAAVFGLAGADRPPDYAVLWPIVRELELPKADIVCDTVIALRAGTERPSGVALVCGTGTNCLGINARGESHTCGGFGYVLGDFAGGNALAVQVFRSVIRAWEGRGSETALTSLVLAALSYPDVGRMYDACLDEHIYPPVDLARLAFEAAAEDELARDLLREQGEELGLAARAVITKLGMERDAFDVVLTGSLLTRGDREGAYIRPHIARAVREVAPRAQLRALTVEPVLGALILAMELGDAEAAARDRLHATLTI